jgi:hypothetical protein
MEPRTYEEFWPYYVSQHMQPGTRMLHVLGTTAVFGCLAAGFLASPLWFLLSPVAGYGPAWIGHFCIEHNTPATFRYPAWSLRGDLRLYRLTLLGRMGPELERAARLRDAHP